MGWAGIKRKQRNKCFIPSVIDFQCYTKTDAVPIQYLPNESTRER